MAAALGIPLLLLLVGAGCFSIAGKTAEEAATPVSVPVTAHKESKEQLEQIAAKANDDADRVSDDLTVGMILTENASAPDGAAVAPGVIGCNDRVAYVRLHREASTDSVLADALATLFAQKDSNVGGLYNALWQTTFEVDKIQSTDGVTTEVWLKGKPISGGVCDDPRIKAQIEATVRRLKPKFKIFLNGKESEYRCIGDMKGDCK